MHNLFRGIPSAPLKITGNKLVDWAIPIGLVLTPVPDELLYAAVALAAFRD